MVGAYHSVNENILFPRRL